MKALLTHNIADVLRGHIELERTSRGFRPHRLPSWARLQCPDPQLLMAESQPAGIHLAFGTDATRIELDVIATKREYVGAPIRPDGIYELVVDGQVAATGSAQAGDVVSIDLSTGQQETRIGPSNTVTFDALPDGNKEVTLWLPHDETTELVALRTNAAITRLGVPERTWVHYGSSISQGSNATRPTATWPVVAARRAGAVLTNLGMGGSALLDPFVARTMRDARADILSLKVGINLVNVDLMRSRGLGPAVHGFLDTIREGNSTAPIALITPLLCPIHETTPGPTALDPDALARGEVKFLATGNPQIVSAGQLTLTVIRDVLKAVVEQREDPLLTLVDGLALYGEPDHAVRPLPDGLHLDETSHRLVGERFADGFLAVAP